MLLLHGNKFSNALSDEHYDRDWLYGKWTFCMAFHFIICAL